MRKGVTLIELIFTMVIVAITFMVIPKLMQAISATSKTVIQEDAIFNSVTLMGLISRLAWDKENITNNAILNVTNQNSNFRCNPTTGTGYRIGGFVGGRNCIVSDGTILSASAITSPGASGRSSYNSIEDYHGYSLGTKTQCDNKLYDLGVKVSYIPRSTGNIKHIQITTQYNTTFKLHKSKTGCVMLDYFSFNIGQVGINKRPWR